MTGQTVTDDSPAHSQVLSKREYEYGWCLFGCRVRSASVVVFTYWSLLCRRRSKGLWTHLLIWCIGKGGDRWENEEMGGKKQRRRCDKRVDDERWVWVEITREKVWGARAEDEIRQGRRKRKDNKMRGEKRRRRILVAKRKKERTAAWQ